MKGNGNTEIDLRERTKQYALRIIRCYSALPKVEVARVIGKQMLRSGTSVEANYREGFRARSQAEFLAKLGICIQELDESAYWLELLQDANIMKSIQLESLQDETNQLIAIFTTIIKKTRDSQ